MSETQAKEDGSGMDVAHLMDISYGRLMNVARSAREQFEELEDAFDGLGRGLTKEGICEEMEDLRFDYDDADGWSVPIDGEREEIDLLEVQTNQGSSGSGPSNPTDETVLYGLTRANTEEYIDELQEAIEENSRFDVREQDADSGTKYIVFLPAEEQEGYVDPEEAESSESESDAADEDSAEDEGETSEEDEEETESEESGPETEESDEAEAESEESEETEDSEDAEEEAEEDDEAVDADTVREHWSENKTKDELYNMAVEEDINDRSNMSKSELIDALIEAKDEVSA